MAVGSTWRWAAAVLVLVSTGPPPSAAVTGASEVVEANLEVVGHSDLGGPGIHGDVAVVGTTAVVASQPVALGCAGSTAKVVDVKDPGQPRAVAVLRMPAGAVAADIDAAVVATPAFTGDLVAVALGRLPQADGACGDDAFPDVVYYDLTEPAQPRFLASSPRCAACPQGAQSVSLAQRSDGRVLSVRAGTDGAIAVAVDDVTDPVHPLPLGRWRGPEGSDGCRSPGLATGAELHDDGQGAVVASSDGRVYDLDLLEPATPVAAAGEDGPSEHGGGGGAPFVAILPVGRRTLAIVSADTTGACSDAPAATGVRVLELGPGTAPREIDAVRFPTAAAPSRLVSSGELAFVAWHTDGIRVIDFGEVRPRTVAQFVPSDADVVAVDLLADHVVVIDRTSGLYVLDRPEEGHTQSFWSRVGGGLPYAGFAGAVGVIAFLMQKARLAGASASPSGAPARAPRRG